MKAKSVNTVHRVVDWVTKRPMLSGFLTMIIVMVIGFVLLSREFPQETALVYTQDVFLATKQEYCAGDNLTARIEGKLGSERTVNVIATTIRDVDGRGYVHEGDSRVVAQSPIVEEGTVFGYMLGYPLPDDISPGTYRYTQNILQNGVRAIEGFDVFFNVKDCP